MPCYFAYGSNLSARQMAFRCPGATALGPARLDGYQLAFTRPSRRWGGCAADILPAPGSHAWGLAWNVSEAHLESLDRFEGVASGAYRRLEVSLIAPRAELDAIAYAVVEPEEGGHPSARYLHTILEGAREHGLPAPWLRHLTRLAT
jgi:gamma-glutamylcyclotransferase (GGCT)/AIG2-like uncharacterized protein YtfP